MVPVAILLWHSGFWEETWPFEERDSIDTLEKLSHAGPEGAGEEGGQPLGPAALTQPASTLSSGLHRDLQPPVGCRREEQGNTPPTLKGVLSSSGCWNWSRRSHGSPGTEFVKNLSSGGWQTQDSSAESTTWFKANSDLSSSGLTDGFNSSNTVVSPFCGKQYFHFLWFQLPEIKYDLKVPFLLTRSTETTLTSLLLWQIIGIVLFC